MSDLTPNAEKRSKTPFLAALLFAISAVLLVAAFFAVRRTMGNPDGAYALWRLALPAILIVPLLLRNERLTAVFSGVLLAVSSGFLVIWIVACFREGSFFWSTWTIIWAAFATAFVGMLQKCLHRGARLRRVFWFVPSLPYLLTVAVVVVMSIKLDACYARDILALFQNLGEDLLLMSSIVSFGIAFLFLGRWIKED